MGFRCEDLFSVGSPVDDNNYNCDAVSIAIVIRGPINRVIFLKRKIKLPHHKCV
jgi:hypothetical protein